MPGRLGRDAAPDVVGFHEFDHQNLGGRVGLQRGAEFLTLGLFLFVINALLFWGVAEIVGGFRVTGFGAALVGSILYSLITLLTSWLLLPGRK